MVTFRFRLSSRAPIDADASPLPSDDTTPPVTNMNLVMRLPLLAIPTPLTRRESAGSFQVLRCIYLDALTRALRHFDAEPPFERAQLFQLLGAFERRRSQP